MTLQDRILRNESRIASTLFFLSGMTGLSYEVIWFKLFSHVWGSSTLAMASVVGAFLAGLGFGARIGDTVSNRVARFVFWYGACEIGIGLLALLIPWEVDALWHVAVTHYSTLRESPLWYAVARCALTFIIIGPSCLMMGATLPLLVRHFSSNGQTALATSHLYGVNTLGASLGCYLVGFHFLPEIGLAWTNVVTALANLSIGISAILFSRCLRHPGQLTVPIAVQDIKVPAVFGTSSTQELAIGVPSVSVTYVIAALTGCAALILQTVWNRQLCLVLGSSTYAFSAMLLIVLAGIGFGSLLFNKILVAHSNDGSLVIHVITFSLITSLLGVALLPFVADCVAISIPYRADYMLNALIGIAASAVVEFLPATAMGVLFPLLVQLKMKSDLSGPVSVGSIYAFNTLGTLIGAVTTSLWIVPYLGTRIAIVIAMSLYLVAAQLLATYTRLDWRNYVGIVVACGSLVLYVGTTDDPRRLNMGMFLYGYEDPHQTTAKVLYFREASACNVLVTQNDETVSLRVNGKVDGGNSDLDMSMQAGLAYLPRFLNPSSKRVLVIGFGTGTTSGASLLFPDTDVTCCEIEPAIVSASPYFAGINHSPEESSRFNVVYDDARAYTQGTTEQFDLILSEPSNPWIAGVSNLFTSEFYEIASRKLAPNGIFAQWVQTYSFESSDYAMIVRTMSVVFPYQRLIRISGGDTILLGMNAAPKFDSSIVQVSQSLVDASAAMKADLHRNFGTSDVHRLLLTRVILDERGIRTFAETNGDSTRNRDCDQQLEFRAARHLFKSNRREVGREILKAADPDWLIEQFGRFDGETGTLESVNELATVFVNESCKETAASLIRYGLGKAPSSPGLLANQLLLSDGLDLALFDRLLSLPDDSVAYEAARLGAAYSNRREYANAVKVLEGLCGKFPLSATGWTQLAMNFERLGNTKQAGVAIRRAVELDPANLSNFEKAKRLQ